VVKLIRFWQVVVVAVLIAVALLLLTFQPDDAPVLRSLAPLPVLISHARRVDLQPEEVVSGYLQPAQHAWLRFEVAGRVAERLVEPGQGVVSGQSLLTLESRDYRDALVQAQAAWRQAQENLARDRHLLKLADRSRQLQAEEVARLKRLKERSLASRTRLGDSQVILAQRQSDVIRLRASVETGPQQVAARKAALDRAQRDLDRTTLRAPFGGRINQVNLEPGDYAERSRQVVEVVSTTLEFYAQVRGETARALAIGQSVPVSVAGTVYSATVISVQPDPDPTTFTHAIHLRMPTGETRSGAVAIARLPLKPLRQALVIPVTAVLRDEGRISVFRVAGQHLQQVPVTLGSRVGEQQVVDTGLQAGEAVVVRDVAALSDGQAVIPEALQDIKGTGSTSR